MFRLDQALKVYLHRKPIDFRLNINGLALLVEQALGLDPFAPCAYVFANRRRDVEVLGSDAEQLSLHCCREQLQGALHGRGRGGAGGDGGATPLAARGHRHRRRAAPSRADLRARSVKRRHCTSFWLHELRIVTDRCEDCGYTGACDRENARRWSTCPPPKKSKR